MDRGVRSALLLPLAALLGIQREPYVVCRYLWQTILLPCGAGQAYSGGGTAEASWMDRFSRPEVLLGDELDNLVRWSHLVDEHYDQSIEIAARRGLSAVANASTRRTL
jgi:hypothetical protein